MILLYRVLTNILYPFLIIYIFIRVLKKKEDPKRFKEKILFNFFNVNKNKKLELLWFHASSVGELKSIIPIITELNKKYKIFEFLITTTTLSSSFIARSEFKNFDNIKYRFFPLDVDFLMERFLRLWQPKKIFLVDSEVWPNLILKAKKYNISIGLINARLTKKSFKKWSLFPNTAKKIFSTFDLCLCSNNETKNFLKELDVKNIKYFGNIKLINKNLNRKFDDKNSGILAKSRFWIAASTHEEEDIFCLNTHINLKKVYKDIITIIAPRHINRVKKIESLCRKLNLKTQILNLDDNIDKKVEILIVNSFGVLHNYFFHAKSAFIGKSMIERLKNDSGQNPIDAAYLNCKVYHGPYVSNFQEIYEILNNINISKRITSHHELSENLLIDFRKGKKEELRSAKMQSLSDDVFSKTMKNIENFLYAKTY